MKMKTLMITAAAAILTISAARADDWWSDHFYYDTAHTHMAFNANEFTIDSFASYMVSEHPGGNSWSHSWDHGSWGGGLGLNFFFLQYLGVGVDSSAQCGTVHFIDHVGGNLILRLPIEAAHLAPYIFGGGGRSFNPDWRWFGDGGAGLEFRLNPKLGLFSDGRYILKEGAKNDQVQFRAGIRLAF